jgi:hypothetical protein
MLFNKKIHWAAIGFACIGLMTGCVTDALYDKQFSNYTDTFSSVLISTDHKTLAVLSSRYHYVFNASQGLALMLTSSTHKNITAQIYDFTLTKENAISGRVELCLPATASAADITSVTANGFTKYNEHSPQYCKAYALEGVRYKAGKTMVSQTYQLNQSYTVNVKAEDSHLARGVKIALTPITIAADGVVAIAAVPFIAVYVIALANSPGAFAH